MFNASRIPATKTARSIDRALRYFQRKKWRPVNIERLYFLALPTIQHEPKLRDPFEVLPRALVYRITKRTERLAIKKKLPEIPLRVPGAVSPAATKAIGSNTHLVIAIIIILLPLLLLSIIIIRFAVTDPPAWISLLDTRRNRRHRSGRSDVVAYIDSPHQYYYMLLDVVSKLIRGVSQRTSPHRDSTRTFARFFLDERFMREVTLFVRNF